MLLFKKLLHGGKNLIAPAEFDRWLAAEPASPDRLIADDKKKIVIVQ